MQYKLISYHKKILADTLTPVSLYLKVRDRFPNSLLLESSDYHANDNSFSYICCQPIGSIQIDRGKLSLRYPDGKSIDRPLEDGESAAELIEAFSREFESIDSEPMGLETKKFATNGLFGYLAYDAVRYFESVTIEKEDPESRIPDIYYALYQFIIAINHFKNEAHLFCHSHEGSNQLSQIEQLINSRPHIAHPFRRNGELRSPVSDEEYKGYVDQAKKHCQRGDVFQLVLSRRFEQPFRGDEFNVYRALRSINPSPYLFFFDYGNFKIFGSSPEAQLIIKDGLAEIHPIAGTYKRTGNDKEDAALAEKLAADEKENSEHVMLVDLARNDLGRNGHTVNVATYREVQYFSHVIHLVSKVTGEKKPEVSSMQVVADTFPAGTLSGAPKHRALQLIEQYEKTPRGYYGGAIGFMDFKGNFNHAIMIRTFLSKNQRLFFQAGAGLVVHSQPEEELQETYNKLGALNRALELAETI